VLAERLAGDLHGVCARLPDGHRSFVYQLFGAAVRRMLGGHRFDNTGRNQ
jgi:hypothetical protein